MYVGETGGMPYVIFPTQVSRRHTKLIQHCTSIRWHNMCHIPCSFQVVSSVYMALPSAMVPAWHSICHTTLLPSAIFYNFCKYNIFYRPDEAMFKI